MVWRDEPVFDAPPLQKNEAGISPSGSGHIQA